MRGKLRSFAKAHWKLVGGLLLIGTAGLWIGADLAVSSLLERLRPQLEKQLSEPLGHPLRIGAYRGLRPWGLAIGPSKVLPGPEDASTASLSGLTVSLAPIASLRHLRPVAAVTLEGAQLSLRRNPNGDYWVLGESNGDPPPNLGLKLRLIQPAKVRVEPADLDFTVTTNAAVQLAERSLKGSLQLGFPDRGRLFLQGQGRWDNLTLKGRARFDRINLEPLQALVPGTVPVQMQGQLGGDLSLSLEQGRMACRGGMSLVGFKLSGGSLNAALTSPQAQMSCRNDQLQLPLSQWRYGSWMASVEGGARLNQSVNLDLKISEKKQGHVFQGKIDGPWYEPSWRLRGDWALAEQFAVDGPLKLDLKLQTNWRNPKAIKANLDWLAIQAPGLQVRAKGALYPEFAVSSQRLQLAAPAWEKLEVVPDLLGTQSPINGTLALTGPSNSPRLALRLAQQSNPILESWSLDAGWSAEAGLLTLKQFNSPQLLANGRLPLTFDQRGLNTGELQADLNLSAFPLVRLGPLLGTSMNGTFAASGQLKGPLLALKPDLSIQVVNPEVGGLRLLEDWRGTFAANAEEGSDLRIASVGGVIPGSLSAHLGTNWLPTELRLRRRQGTLSLKGNPGRYLWQVENLGLAGIELALPPKQNFEGLYGQVSGAGSLGLQPLAMDGQLTMLAPGLMGLQLKQALFQLHYANNLYKLTGELLPSDTGQIVLQADGRLGSTLKARADVRGLSARWLMSSALQLPQLTADLPAATGRADDLGSLLVQTFGGSLDGQLKALVQAQKDLRLDQQLMRQGKAFDPEDLRGQVDAVIDLQGPDLSRLTMDLKARGHLWTEGQDADHALQVKPFVATLSGPLFGGEGQFSLLHLPFSLLSLLTPFPPAITGALGMTGRYRWERDTAEVSADLVLEDARLADTALRLKQGQVLFADDRLKLDLALGSGSSQELVTLRGQVPLDPSMPMDLRVESHGDGLRFLAGFADGLIAWEDGDADLRLLISGSLKAPQANGFLVMREGEFVVKEQLVSDVKGSMLFDFNRVEVEELEARIGSQGKLFGKGAIALLRPEPEDEPLVIELSKARIKLPVADVLVAANLTLKGALLQPRLGGSLTIDEGEIKPGGSSFVRPVASISKLVKGPGVTLASNEAIQAKAVDANTLLEEQWDFSKPLLWLGPDVEDPTSKLLRAGVPNIPAVSFENLRLALGPNLRIKMEPLANFRTQGLLTLNGPLDPSLQARGVVRLINGRVNLFTTTFSLDKRAPNVAVFTPSLGLIPYLDVAMTSRVSDTIDVETGTASASANVFDTNGTGVVGVAGQLRLVKVMVEVEGLANRFADNIILRSSPPMPRSQLLGLIGGNSLAGLSGGQASTALATVLGQSLLSPFLGSLSDAFSQRMQVAFYPTYVSPEVTDGQERVSGKVPPQLTLVTEVGINVTDRFDLSVVAAPNRNDIPSQGNITYQLTPNVGLAGSMDTQGTWQSQLQLFFRF